MNKAVIITFIAIVGLVTASFKSESQSLQENDEKLTWYTDLDKAYEISEESGKPIFGFFTGSDWCGWCHKLQREVFAKDAFIEWAQKEVVLLELDFPRKKKLPEELAKQNRELQQAFKVTGYPTVWIFFADKDPDTDHFNLTALGKLGYPSGAVKGKEEVKFLDNANKVLANKDKASN
ncbi:MAG: thioredoxin family protein [Crocinitomicaceae bacterium]|nr:thioredoxin family protein [Crocinitomicaceae bacterium]